MGGVVSRCAHNVRNAWRRCSKSEHDDETMLSNTCDSEPLDKCCQQPLFDPSSASGIDRTSSLDSLSSLVRVQEKMDRVDMAESRLMSSTPRKDSPHLGRAGVHVSCHRTTEPQDGWSRSNDHHGPDHLEPLMKKATSRLVDRGSQTYFEGSFLSDSEAAVCSPSREPSILSKEYIVKTYRIQNATPSPATQAKFSPSSRAVTPPHPSPSSLSADYPTAASDYVEKESLATDSSPLAILEKRQESVLERLKQLKSSVSKLAQQYSVSAKSASDCNAAVTATTTTTTKSWSMVTNSSTEKSVLGGSILDLVVNVDPSSIPLSLLVLCEQLSGRYSVIKSTFVHSNVNDIVPDRLRSLLSSNGSLKRSDAQLAVSLVWKKLDIGPQLVVDPTKQTPIQGEANIARYIARLLCPSGEETNVITATQIDELLDLAQLQIVWGNAKEKAAALRTLNSTLGKSDWLVGDGPGVADIVCWSVLHQSGQAANPPANVKRWLGSCKQHKLFETAVGFLS